MPEIFLIADTHFGHKNILEFEKERRPFSCIEEHDEELVRRWNETVKVKDTVWHLGDVLFGKCNFPILDRLNGNKKLVMGNHDQYPVGMYAEYFTKVYGCASFKGGIILTHVPIHESQFYRYKVNVHGHSHSKRMVDSRYICVSAEQTGLKPISLSVIRERMDEEF